MKPKLSLKGPKFVFTGILETTVDHDPALIQERLQSLRTHVGHHFAGAIDGKFHRDDSIIPAANCHAPILKAPSLRSGGWSIEGWVM